MRFLILLLALATPLCANDIAVASGESTWLLLENPYHQGGAGFSEYANDPGLPVPDLQAWPYDGAPSGTYPQTDLWRFDAYTQKYTRVTDVLSGDRNMGFKRTLHDPFLINGQLHVLHYDPRLSLKRGYTQVLRVGDGLAGDGGVPASAIMLGSTQYLECPTVSPDGAHVCFRAFTSTDKPGVFRITLRVFSTSDWTQTGESSVATWARPVWLDASTLACIAWDAARLPRVPMADPKFSGFASESHAPQPGKLLLLAAPKGVPAAPIELLAGSFPPDNYTRTLLAEPSGLGLLLARELGKEIVVEQRSAKPAAKLAATDVVEVARFVAFRGLATGGEVSRASGVVKVDRRNELKLLQYVPTKEGRTKERVIQLAIWSTEGHGGLLDCGDGIVALLEPVANPAGPSPMLRHTLQILNWEGADSMRNPALLARLSRMVARFDEVERSLGRPVGSTLLAFDIEIAANDGQNEKKGRYIEIFGNRGRGGKGRIRTEDSLSGDWIVQALSGNGTRDGDEYWSCSDIKATELARKSGTNAGKAYDDLVTQLETRKLLLLNGVQRTPETGGLRFRGRDTHHDPFNGTTRRVWVYEKLGAYLDEPHVKKLQQDIAAQEALVQAETDAAKRAELEKALRTLTLELLAQERNRERMEVRFVADLPSGSAGDWQFPHALARAKLRFALSNGRGASETELMFDPAKFTALANLTDAKQPELLLPSMFGIFEWNPEKKKWEQRLKATAVEGEFSHPADLVKGGKLRGGYEVPLVNFGDTAFTRKTR